MLSTQYLGKGIYCHISVNMLHILVQMFHQHLNQLELLCMNSSSQSYCSTASMPACSVSYLVHFLPVVCLPVGRKILKALDLEPLG